MNADIGRLSQVHEAKMRGVDGEERVEQRVQPRRILILDPDCSSNDYTSKGVGDEAEKF